MLRADEFAINTVNNLRLYIITRYMSYIVYCTMIPQSQER